MTNVQKELLERFVERFGFPNMGGALSFWVLGRGASRLDFPPDAQLYLESDVVFVYQMQDSGLVSVYDHRDGETFDGEYGLNPGWMAGKPTDEVNVVICNDEALDWLDARRPK